MLINSYWIGLDWIGRAYCIIQRWLDAVGSGDVTTLYHCSTAAATEFVAMVSRDVFSMLQMQQSWDAIMSVRWQH